MFEPPCLHSVMIYSTRSTQPPLLCLLLGQPHSPTLSVDVLYEWFLTMRHGDPLPTALFSPLHHPGWQTVPLHTITALPPSLTPVMRVKEVEEEEQSRH